MKYHLLLTLGLSLTACTTMTGGQITDVTVLGLNDFHGNLEANPFSGVKVQDPRFPNDPSKKISLLTGGVEALGTLISDIRKENPNTLFVGVGDLIGASPLASSLLRDEPTILAMNQLGMVTSTVGNHEFDQGYKELMRMAQGGCASNAADKACKFDANYPGAKFQYLAANVIDAATNKPIFPAYSIQKIGGASVAFIGVVLRSTPTVVTPSGVAGLNFTDEVAAINGVIPELKAQKVDAIVALVHQGGAIDTSKESFDTEGCSTLSGDIVSIATNIDPAVSVVMSAHTHRGYSCLVGGRMVIQGDSYGHLLQRVDLKVDLTAHKVLSVKARNVLVDATKLAKDPALTPLVVKAKSLTDPIANREVVKLPVPQLSRANDASGESPLGDAIADSQLAATRDASKGGAVIAFMNPGGIRADLPGTPREGNSVTYGDLFTVQPFGNSLTVMSLTGAQINTLLEQQFDNSGVTGQVRILQVSQGFTYKFDTTKAAGSRVSEITLNGMALDPAVSYRVTVNSFLADGGDGFKVLASGTNRLGGDLDVDAFSTYIQGGGKVQAESQKRVVKVQ